MTYKKVTPISKGVLRIRSEPDESGRVCGSVSYGEEVTVETTKVTSKKGKEYYRLAGYGYILASQVRDAESQTETEAKVDAAVKCPASNYSSHLPQPYGRLLSTHPFPCLS